MQVYKFVSGLALAVGALVAVVLLAVLGNDDIAILVAVAASLVGMYVLRHRAPARLFDRTRPPSAGDPSLPEPRRPERTSGERTEPTGTGTMRGPFY